MRLPGWNVVPLHLTLPFTSHILSRDEPATGACSNSRFYCPNTGHQGTQIAVSRVNGEPQIGDTAASCNTFNVDAVCDCCDGRWVSRIACFRRWAVLLSERLIFGPTDNISLSDEWARSADLSVSHPPHAISLSLKRSPPISTSHHISRANLLPPSHLDLPAAPTRAQTSRARVLQPSRPDSPTLREA